MQISRDEQLAILQQLTYRDSRKIKEGRRGKKYVISKALFLQAFYGKTNKLKRQIVDDFFSKVKIMTEQTKMQDLISLGNSKKSTKEVKIAPISPRYIK